MDNKISILFTAELQKLTKNTGSYLFANYD
jgi:hypothetical protein